MESLDVKWEEIQGTENDENYYTEILIISCCGMGHFNPCKQLARALTTHGYENFPTVRITLVAPLTPNQANIVRQQKREEKVNIIILESISDDMLVTFDWFARILQAGVIDTKVKEYYRKASRNPSLVIGDMLAVCDVSIAEYYGVKVVGFFPSPLYCFVLWNSIMLKTAGENVSIETFRIPGIDLIIENQDLFKSTDIINEKITDLLKREAEIYNEKAGVIINDVNDFYNETTLTAAKINKGFSIFNIGPLFMKYDTRTVEKYDDTYEWLENMPKGSVIYVSMGSSYDLQQADLVELAYALESCGHKVLWVLRSPQKSGQMKLANEEVDDRGLPIGFVERTEGRVLVKKWCNQLQVLSHPSIGLFITHGGWNSLLETLSMESHVPLLCIPCAAEQALNSRMMQDHFKVAKRAWCNPDYDNLDRINLNRLINECMNNDELRNAMKPLSEKVKMAWHEKGSATLALKAIFELWG